MKQFLLIFLFTFSFLFSQDKHLMKIGDNLIFPDEFLAEKNNLASLTKLLEEYVDNIHLLKQDAIFKYIEDEFSVSEKAMQTVSVYEDVLQS